MIDKLDVFPDACNVILMDFYVDDLISGSNTIDHAKRLAHDIDMVLRNGCFPLRKWNSSSKEIIDSIQSSRARTKYI